MLKSSSFLFLLIIIILMVIALHDLIRRPVCINGLAEFNSIEHFILHDLESGVARHLNFKEASMSYWQFSVALAINETNLMLISVLSGKWQSRPTPHKTKIESSFIIREFRKRFPEKPCCCTALIAPTVASHSF